MNLPPFIREFLKKKEMAAFYKQFIKKDDLYFDIGANIGERTEVLLNIGARVIAIEPQYSCYKILTEKFRNNKRVEVLKLAVGSIEKEDELMICSEANECSSLSKEFIAAYSEIQKFHWNSKEKINVTTVENLIGKYGIPAFCKIDVEGYESEVIKGMNIPIKFVAFEFNKPLLKDTKICIRSLNTLGNYNFNFIKYERMNLVLDKWLESKEFIEAIENHIVKDNILTGEIIAKVKN